MVMYVWLCRQVDQMGMYVDGYGYAGQDVG